MIIRTLPVLGVKTDCFFNIAFKVCLVYLLYKILIGAGKTVNEDKRGLEIEI
jgi:hypothetical protein